ncbi:hypothetical protein AB0P15_02700 [Streptomyces sp. NPDC087917]|uniref:hypothetical protein n=1 Tax=Streptomyces sp. NPDC087917 TaxID=3155060 RepID=UPI0034478ABC
MTSTTDRITDRTVAATTDTAGSAVVTATDTDVAHLHAAVASPAAPAPPATTPSAPSSWDPTAPS